MSTWLQNCCISSWHHQCWNEWRVFWGSSVSPNKAPRESVWKKQRNKQIKKTKLLAGHFQKLTLYFKLLYKCIREKNNFKNTKAIRETFLILLTYSHSHSYWIITINHSVQMGITNCTKYVFINFKQLSLDLWYELWGNMNLNYKSKQQQSNKPNSSVLFFILFYFAPFVYSASGLLSLCLLRTELLPVHFFPPG